MNLQKALAPSAPAPVPPQAAVAPASSCSECPLQPAPKPKRTIASLLNDTNDVERELEHITRLVRDIEKYEHIKVYVRSGDAARLEGPMKNKMLSVLVEHKSALETELAELKSLLAALEKIIN